MRLIEQASSLRTYLRGKRADSNSIQIGFVPTMGALHDGHLSLFRKAKSDCDVVVASIFVNPTQFGPNEDLSSYPRTPGLDESRCSNEGVDALFVPSVDEMYPAGFQTSVSVSELSSILEGAHRPGHFNGVATVVMKLVNMVHPDRVYLGQKDYQQAILVDRMLRDLDTGVDMVMVPTVRAADGLALSSRNAYLSAPERSAATVLVRALRLAQGRVEAGASDPAAVVAEMNTLIASESLARADYVALVDPATLLPVTTFRGGATLAVLAVRIGKTRLIDNMLLSPGGEAAAGQRQ